MQILGKNYHRNNSPLNVVPSETIENVTTKNSVQNRAKLRPTQNIKNLFKFCIFKKIFIDYKDLLNPIKTNAVYSARIRKIKIL